MRENLTPRIGLRGRSFARSAASLIRNDKLCWVRIFLSLMLSLILLSAAQGAQQGEAPRVIAPELLPLQMLPTLGKEWKLVRPATAPSGPFVDRSLFSNTVSGDVLCFAIRRHDGPLTPALGLEYYAGMAYESQLDLADRPSSNSGDRSAYTLRINTVSLDDVSIPKARASQPDAGEFSFILESKSAPNLLAHGYVVHHRNLLFYVQHTSVKVITPDLAASSMQRWLGTFSTVK